MKKILSILTLTAISIILLSMYYIKINQKNYVSEQTLIKAFNYSGARVIDSEVYLWGTLGKKYDTLEKLKLLTDDISKSLGIIKNNTYTNNTTKNNTIEKIELRGFNAQKNIIEVNAQINKQSGSAKERIVTVSVMQDLSSAGLEEIRKNVTNLLKGYGVNSKVNSCIVGNFEGKLNSKQLNDVCIRMFNGAEAKKVEGMKDNNLISVSAYSPFINDSIEVNGKKVNLNLAIRYSSYDNKTYIWLATPVITTEY